MVVPDVALPMLDWLREEHLRKLIRVSQEFNSTLDTQTLLPRVLDLVIETVGAEAGSLWLLEGETLRCHLARGATAEVVEGLELPLGAGIIGDAVQRRTPLLVTEVQEDPRFLHQIDELAGFQTQSVIAVPLICRGEVLGGIELLNERAEDGVFSDEHHHFLEVLADDAAAAIRNAKLFEAERQARDLAALLEARARTRCLRLFAEFLHPLSSPSYEQRHGKEDREENDPHRVARRAAEADSGADPEQTGKEASAVEFQAEELEERVAPFDVLSGARVF